MKKLTLFWVIVLSATLLIGGCGNFGKNADKEGAEDALIINEKDKVGGSIESGAGYGFTQFDLEIDIDNQDAIDAEYHVSPQKFEAEYENKLNGIKLKDNEAMIELDKFFLDIRITKDTPEQEIIDKILKWFQFDAYTKFDLEVDFDDGTKLNIEDVNGR